MSQVNDETLEEITINESVLDLEVPKVEIKTAEQIKTEFKDLKYKNYCINFKDRIDAWIASHPSHVPPPIQYDTQFGDFVWINRSQRRFR